MNVEILIATWSKDIEYLRYNLKSIAKFASGFSGTTLLVAQQEEQLFKPICEEFGCSLAMYDRVSDPKYWHLQHQTEKCMADVHCPNADLVLFTDSDCVFTAPVTPENYIIYLLMSPKIPKPILLIEEFSRLQGNPWKPEVDRALGIDAKYETMRRHPAVHWREMFKDFRNRVETVHHMPFFDYVMRQKPEFPWGFSEFASMGAFCLWSDLWKTKYDFIDAKDEFLYRRAVEAGNLLQFWSHAPIDQPQALPSGGRGCPIETFRKLGL